MPPEEGAEDEELVFKIMNDQGNIIGGCILEIDSWKIAYLEHLWVDEKHRRIGLGSTLIREAEKAARKRDCYVMGLGTFSFRQGRSMKNMVIRSAVHSGIIPKDKRTIY